ncbi:MAG: VWA domain-containing protein [Lentimonas sp.]
MNFEYPVWLSATTVIVLITAGIIAFGLRRRDNLLGRFAASRLMDQLTEKASHTRTLIKACCVVLGIAAIGIALARPQYGIEWSERKARGLDLVFVLDSSKSMLATDIRPTRLDRAKLAIVDLIERLKSDRIGLVAFAGRAFLQTPPTLDYSAFKESLEITGPGTMTSGGSDLGNAIREAEKAFPKDNNFKVIILLTDGEDLGGGAINAATEAAKNGIKIYAIGIGTPEGEYLRIRNDQGKETFIRDADGKPVRSQLDEATLRKITQLTGGSYSRLSAQSLEALYSSVIATLPREEREAELQERPIERFQWLLGLALLFLVLEILIRRRSNSNLLAAWILLSTFHLAANKTTAQELPVSALEIVAEAKIIEKNPPIEDPRVKYNKAYEALQSGDLDAAKDLYEASIAQTEDLKLQRDALYNIAHSNYRSGRQTYDSGDLKSAIEQVKEAEDQFQSVLELDPNDTAAAEDLKKVTAVREAMEQIEEQQEQQEQQNSEQENQESQENESSENSESQDSEQQQGQSSEQNNQGEDSENQNSDSEQNSSGNESESPEEEQEAQEQNSEFQNEPGEESDEQSTRNPAEDMEAQESEEEAESKVTAEEGEGDSSEQASNSAQVGEQNDEAEGTEDGQAAAQAVQIEGMTQEDATALLNTLRNSEKLLPFVDQQTPRHKGHLKDW